MGLTSSMRKLTIALLAFFMFALTAHAQSTVVTGNVTDQGGQAWIGGSYTWTLLPNPQYPTGPYTWTGGALTTTFSGSLDGGGNYSQSLPSNTAISPAGSTWVLQVVPNASSQGFKLQPAAISGPSQAVNATPPAIQIR